MVWVVIGRKWTVHTVVLEIEGSEMLPDRTKVIESS